MEANEKTGERVPEPRSAQPTTLTLPPASPPVGPARPARQLDAQTRRFADEVVGLLHRRLLAGTAIAAVAFALMILVALASPHGRSEYLSLTLYASLTLCYAGLTAWLARNRDLSLSQLRIIEVVALAAYAAHCAQKTSSITRSIGERCRSTTSGWLSHTACSTGSF